MLYLARLKRWKKGIALFVAVTLINSGLPVAQAEAYQDGYSYAIINNEYAVITGYTGNETELTIPETLDGKPVKEIGQQAFYNKSLRNVMIPNSVQDIGYEAFAYNQLESVTIPNSVTNIGGRAFRNNQLMSVTIPDSIQDIGYEAFRSNQLTTVTIPDSVQDIGYGAFAYNQLESVTIPNSVTNIGAHVFYRNQLESVTIPDSVQHIGDGAFRYNQLTSIRIPNNVTSFGNNPFRDNPLKVIIGELDSAAQTYAGNYGIIFLNFDPWSSTGQVQKEAATTVTALWNKAFSLQYQWATSEEEPTLPTELDSNGWIVFENGTTLNYSLDDAQTTDSTWYVHIYAEDESGGELFTVHSGAFLLEVPAYEVNFDSNDGTPVDSQMVNRGDAAAEPEAPTRVGYTFDGWYSDAGLTMQFDFDTPITKDTTLYAKWQINRYTLTYTAGAGGSIDGETLQTVDHGNDGKAVTAIPDEGYHFVKWSDGNTVATRADENVTANVNVTAEFAMNSYAVSFESNGGSGVDSQTVNYGGTVSEPPAPTQTGYTFVGWFVDIDLMTSFDFMTPITKDVTLYAKWTINSYTVIFEENGGMAVDSQTVNHGDTAIEPNEPTRPGYVFDGWHTDIDLTVPFDFNTPIIGDLTLYAKWRLPEQVAKPKATPSGGVVLAGTPVVLSTTTVSAAVYYTTDGTEPSIYSIKYTGPIEVTHDMTIKAIAVKEGMLDSDVLTEHYTIATLPAPVSLTATPSDRSVILNWHAAAKERSVMYAVYQVEGISAPVDPANWELVQARITANTFTVTGLTNGKTYAFGVKAIYAEGESVFSNVATAMPKARDDGGGSGDDGGSGGSPGGGGHGGGIVGDSGMVLSTTGVITIPTGRSGEVRLDDEIIIKVSSGAAEQELHITVKKFNDASSLLTDQETLVSHIFEVLKNVSDHFKKPVTLSIKFDPSKVGKDQKVAIFYYDEEDKRWVEVGGKVEGDWITVEVDHFTKFAVLAVNAKKEDGGETPKQPAPSFTDIAGHWGERSIIAAASQRLVSGYPDGTFKPNNPITRAEFTVMLVNALRMDGIVTTPAFTDQAKIGSWAKHAIALAVQHDIINGYGDGSFRPDVFITRAEMSVMIARALEVTMDVNAQTGFADDEDIPHWAKGAVEAIRQLGIISGRGDNQFVPNETATRAEAIVMLLRMLENKDI